MKAAAKALLCCCLAVTGCNKYFAAKGVVSSPEGHLGTWSSTPPGCTRDPFDGLPISETSSVLTFLWEDPSIHDPLRGPHRAIAPDAPMRLALSRTGSAYAVDAYAIDIDTVKTEGTQFDSRACGTFAVETHDTPKTIPEGRPSLSGSLRFDCRNASSHITANIRFNRCEY